MSEDSPAYKLTVDLPDLPKGELVQIPGLGTFENGSSYEVTQEEADGYRVYHQFVKPVTNKDGAIVGAETELGNTLLEAAKTMYGVEVETVGNKKKKGDDN